MPSRAPLLCSHCAAPRTPRSGRSWSGANSTSSVSMTRPGCVPLERRVVHLVRLLCHLRAPTPSCRVLRLAPRRFMVSSPGP